MTTTRNRDERRDLDQHRSETKDALIGEQVLHALGEPGDLLRVQVRQLWPDRYRVNVCVGADAASVTVADSYFLQVDGDGNIVASAPKITRRYGPEVGGGKQGVSRAEPT